MAIKFKIIPEAAWIYGNDPAFDKSELGYFTTDQRRQIRFKVFPLTSELVRELQDKHKIERSEISFSSDNPIQRQVELNNRAYQLDLLDRIVVDWEGISDENETPLSCNLDNKLKLFERGYPMIGVCLLRIAGELMARFDSYQKKREEEELKNSQASQSGQDAGK